MPPNLSEAQRIALEYQLWQEYLDRGGNPRAYKRFTVSEEAKLIKIETRLGIWNQ